MLGYMIVFIYRVLRYAGTLTALAGSRATTAGRLNWQAREPYSKLGKHYKVEKMEYAKRYVSILAR